MQTKSVKSNSTGKTNSVLAASDLNMDRDVGKYHKSSIPGNLCFSVTYCLR